eukprot:TRINITY_DN18307_c0_g1_i1.p1 TRINITY_DN18307_c0_g1~~TRINITY_DN18307_c0_g1_i1.p1  ORF type:complete len:258 (+),score=64.29 TRINITY_DN18307_c0_g1_i1:104-877(+)
MSNICLLVTVDIKGERLEDFLKCMEEDAKGTRAEGGCQRFDLLRSRDRSTQFVLYEVYESGAAIDHHKTTAHYKGWVDFKASGGVEKQAVEKFTTSTIPGGWALQPSAVAHSTALPASAVLVAVDVKEDRVDDFLLALEATVKGSRQRLLEPGCLRFDLLRSQETPTRFLLYQAFVDDDAAAFHRTTTHHKAWADFEASGGVVQQEVVRVQCADVPGDWAFQVSTSGLAVSPAAGEAITFVDAAESSPSLASITCCC